jgi:hypothetical protein
MVLNTGNDSSVKLIYLPIFFFFLRFFFALGCALDNRKWIDNFVLQYNYLQPFELSDDDWNMVAQGSSLVIEY